MNRDKTQGALRARSERMRSMRAAALVAGLSAVALQGASGLNSYRNCAGGVSGVWTECMAETARPCPPSGQGNEMFTVYSGESNNGPFIRGCSSGKKTYGCCAATPRPTGNPTAPSTAPTTASPTTSSPTTASPTAPSSAPSKRPSKHPSEAPTSRPTTERPSSAPTSASPTRGPSLSPTPRPTTGRPSSAPTDRPTKAPVPTASPSRAPSRAPSTAQPTLSPSQAPTASPTAPTAQPSAAPSLAPTASPTLSPGRCLVDPVDALRWDEQGSKRFLDFDTQQCLRVCGASAHLGHCVAECLGDPSSGSRGLNNLAGPPYSRPCAGCMGEWAACLRESCRCDSRRDSQACAQCAAQECEPRMLDCSGFAALPPPATGDVNAGGAAPSGGAAGSSAVIGGAAAGGVLLALVALLAVRRSRRRAARSAAATRSDDVAPYKRESANPGFAGAPPRAAQALGPASAPRAKFGNVSVAFPFKAEAMDELSCTSGEGLQLVRRIDKDWALCINERGEQGIVPLNRFARSGPLSV